MLGVSGSAVAASVAAMPARRWSGRRPSAVVISLRVFLFRGAERPIEGG
jgi:hypothetical protein